jgi:hypothetical protein
MNQERRRLLARYIWRVWRYAISTMTMIELLVGLCGGDDSHWNENRDRFAILTEPNPQARILQLPQEFVAEVLVGKSDPDSGYSPRLMRVWFEVIAGARTRQELLTGVYSPTIGEVLPFDCAVVTAELERIRKRYSQVMTEHRERLRNKTAMTFVMGDAAWLTEDSDTGIASQRLWTAAMLHASGIPVTRASVEKAQPALDAAYRYNRWLDSSVGGTYRFENDLNAWVDLHQLVYLCDPAVHLVTADGDHVTRTAGTTQRTQIMTTEEFMNRAGV